jgi:PIN domain
MPPACRFFRSAGGCHRGAACGFAHGNHSFDGSDDDAEDSNSVLGGKGGRRGRLNRLNSSPGGSPGSADFLKQKKKKKSKKNKITPNTTPQKSPARAKRATATPNSNNKKKTPNRTPNKTLKARHIIPWRRFPRLGDVGEGAGADAIEAGESCQRRFAAHCNAVRTLRTAVTGARDDGLSRGSGSSDAEDDNNGSESEHSDGGAVDGHGSSISDITGAWACVDTVFSALTASTGASPGLPHDAEQFADFEEECTLQLERLFEFRAGDDGSCHITLQRNRRIFEQGDMALRSPMVHASPVSAGASRPDSDRDAVVSTQSQSGPADIDAVVGLALFGAYLRCMDAEIDEVSCFFESSNVDDRLGRLLVSGLRVLEGVAGVATAMLRLFANPQLRDGTAVALGEYLVSAQRPPLEIHLSNSGIGWRGMRALYAAVRECVQAGQYPGRAVLDSGEIRTVPLWLRVEWNSVPSHLMRRARGEFFGDVACCPAQIDLGAGQRCLPRECRSDAAAATAVHLVDFESVGKAFHTLQGTLLEEGGIANSGGGGDATALRGAAGARAVLFCFLDTNAVVALLQESRRDSFFEELLSRSEDGRVDFCVRLVVPSVVRNELDNLAHQRSCSPKLAIAIKEFVRGKDEPQAVASRLMKANLLLHLSADSEALAQSIGAPPSNDQLIWSVARQWRYELRRSGGGGNNGSNGSGDSGGGGDESSAVATTATPRDEVLFVSNDVYCRNQAKADGGVPSASLADFQEAVSRHVRGQDGASSPDSLLQSLRDHGAFTQAGHEMTDEPVPPLDLASFARDVRALTELLEKDEGLSSDAAARVREHVARWRQPLDDLLSLA